MKIESPLRQINLVSQTQFNILRRVTKLSLGILATDAGKRLMRREQGGKTAMAAVNLLRVQSCGPKRKICEKRETMNRKLLFLLLLIGCFCFSASGQLTRSDAVLNVLKRYDEAWNRKDLAVVDKILATDYIYFSSTGAISSRQQTLQLLTSPKYKLTSVERSEIKTYRTADTVVVSSRWKGKGTYGDDVINDDQRCSLVFVKQKDSWKLLAEHCTQIVSR